MGVRWDDGEKAFEPLPWWAHLLIGFVVGFALCFLIFVG